MTVDPRGVTRAARALAAPPDSLTSWSLISARSQGGAFVLLAGGLSVQAERLNGAAAANGAEVLCARKGSRILLLGQIGEP